MSPQLVPWLAPWPASLGPWLASLAAPGQPPLAEDGHALSQQRISGPPASASKMYKIIVFCTSEAEMGISHCFALLLTLLENV